MISVLEWVNKQLIISEILSETKLFGINKKLNFYYKIVDFYKNRSKDQRMFILLGLRGVGKTTTLAQFYKFLKDNKAMPLFFMADSQEFFRLKLVDVVKTYRELVDPPHVVIIDEMHKKENWASELKNAFDIFNDVFFLISGSSSLRLKSKILKRRAYFYEAPPLSFSEYCQLNGISTNSINVLDACISRNPYKRLLIEERKANPKAKRLLREYLEIGGFPISLHIDKKLVPIYIYDIASKVVDEDLLYIDSFKSSTIKDAMKILFYIATSSTAEISVRKISKELSISKTAISSLLNALHESGLIIEVNNIKASLRKQPKIYFRSPSLRVALLKHLGADLDIGILREEAVLSVLANKGFKVYFSKNGLDVDFVIKYKGKEIFIEVGGRGKKPLKGKRCFTVAQTDEVTYKNKSVTIPLWLFLLI